MIGLPAGWAVTEFENIADLKLGKMLDKAKNKGTPFRYLRNVNVRWGGFDLSDLLEMRFTDDELETFAIENGDLLICEGGEPGRSAVWRNGTTQIKFQKALHRVRFEEGFSPDFFAAELRHAAVSGSLDELFVGTTIKHLTRQVLACRQVPVPPITEQRRIVAKLDALDARAKRARADLDRIPALVARAKQAILERELVFDSLEAEARNRGWASKSVAEVASLIFDGPFGSNLKSSDYSSDGARVIRLENIGHMQFKSEKETFIPLEKYTSLRRHQLQADDIMFSSFISDEIRVCRYPSSFIGPAINKADCFCIRLQQGICLPRFMEFRLACRSTFITLSSEVHGATRPRISLSHLRSYSFLLPPITEQLEIVRRIESAFQKIDRIAADAASASKLLGRLDQAILTKAFRGELVPQNPEDEPASILLERIRATTKTAPRRGRGREAGAR